MPRFRSIGMPALVLFAVFALPGCVKRWEPPPLGLQSHDRCDVLHGDKSEVRACLVPEGSDADTTKQVGPGCYWRKFDSQNVKFHVKANGNNRRFVFEVVNLCANPVGVTMEFAPVGQEPILEFVTTGCAIADQQAWTIESQSNVVTPCDSKRYTGGHKTYKREVKFYATVDKKTGLLRSPARCEGRRVTLNIMRSMQMNVVRALSLASAALFGVIAMSSPAPAATCPSRRDSITITLSDDQSTQANGTKLGEFLPGCRSLPRLQ